MSRALHIRIRRSGTALLVVLLSSVGAAAQVTSPDSGSGTSATRLELVEHAHLPVGSLLHVLGELRLQLHVAPQLATVYYQPPIVGDAGGPSAESDDLGLGRARLWVRRGLQASPPSGPAGEPLLVEHDGVAELSVLDSTPDVVEPLFYSLVLARLHQRHDREPLFAQRLRDRALQEFGDGAVPSDPAALRSLEEHLVGEYLMASASFASHLVSLANEIERAESRRRAGGKSGLCGQLRQGAGLFGLWRRAFEDETFPVSTFAPDGGERTRNVTPGQRRWIVETLLPESGWQGRFEDHRRLCGSAER